MVEKENLQDDGNLNLIFIAGGEANLNGCIAGSLRSYITDKEMDITGLAVLVCAKEGDVSSERVREMVRVVDAIQGQRLRRITPAEVKRVFSAIGLERKKYLHLPLVEEWRDELVEEMTREGYRDFSDKSLDKYMTNRILEDLCRK